MVSQIPFVPVGVNPDYVSPDGYNLCVGPGCREVTRYKMETPFDARLCYVEGVGQLCPKCYQRYHPRGQSIVPGGWE